MALAACLGLTVAEALNLTCCKNKAVTKENSSYRHLLHLTGLPSIEHMASLDSVSVIRQIFSIKPNWFSKGTYRQQASARLRKTDCIVGIKPHLKGTLVQDLYDLKLNYEENFEPESKIIQARKDAIHAEFKKNMDKITLKKKNYTKKYEQELYRKRRNDLASADTPFMLYYREAIPHCTKNYEVDYCHLMRTFTLRSRFEFDCLDLNDRIVNFKTPRRDNSEITIDSPNPENDINSPVARRTRASRKKHVLELSQKSKRGCEESYLVNEPPAKKQSKPKTLPKKTNKKRKEPPVLDDPPPNKKIKSIATIVPCSVYADNSYKCRFCEKDLENFKKDVKSHLLFYCEGIPNSQPILNINRRRPAGLMARLAAIGAVPDPGGDII